MSSPQPRTAANRCSSCSTARPKASNSPCRPGRMSRAGRPCSTPPRTPCWRSRPPSRQARNERAGHARSWPSRASHDEANPFGPLIAARARHLSPLGAGRAAGRAGASNRPARWRERTTAGSSSPLPARRPGTRYRFRIDDEIEVPDPASHFQPDDVHGPSEVIDHAYRLAVARAGSAGPGTKRLSRTACRHVHAEKARSARRSTSSTICRDRHHRASN